jgi:hypothetical protein
MTCGSPYQWPDRGSFLELTRDRLYLVLIEGDWEKGLLKRSGEASIVDRRASNREVQPLFEAAKAQQRFDLVVSNRWDQWEDSANQILRGIPL